MEVESADTWSSSDNRDEENSKGSEPNGSNEPLDVDTGNPDSLIASETPQESNTEVEDTETNKDNSSCPGVIDEDTTIPELKGHEKVSTEVMESPIVVGSVIEETELPVENTEEVVALTVEVAPIELSLTLRMM
ncbi:uncharacterized protein LOC113294712 [Papaver somniferum]|uniref:uncharacterized protein LOC113294712 n=1 Tax=Papaver somniferum TaxID=3469 RepID=UPI000E6F6844|nr:uncharacterized protein LOC113294712 [Papaver somniferum]